MRGVRIIRRLSTYARHNVVPAGSKVPEAKMSFVVCQRGPCWRCENEIIRTVIGDNGAGRYRHGDHSDSYGRNSIDCSQLTRYSSWLDEFLRLKGQNQS